MANLSLSPPSLAKYISWESSVSAEPHLCVSHTYTHTQYATVLCSSFFFFTAIHHTKELRVNVSLALFPLVTAAHEVEKESRSVSLCRIIGDNNVLYHNSLQQIHHRRRVEI